MDAMSSRPSGETGAQLYAASRAAAQTMCARSCCSMPGQGARRNYIAILAIMLSYKGAICAPLPSLKAAPGAADGPQCSGGLRHSSGSKARGLCAGLTGHRRCKIRLVSLYGDWSDSLGPALSLP